MSSPTVGSRIWTVSVKSGLFGLYSTAVEKVTEKFVYVERSAPFEFRRRFPADQVHADPIECLRYFLAHQERAVELAEQALEVERRGFAWAKERLLIESGAISE